MLYISGDGACCLFVLMPFPQVKDPITDSYSKSGN